MLSFELGDDLNQLQTSVSDFAVKEVRPRLREVEKKGVPAELQKKLDELGLLSLDWPEAAGGQGLGASWRVIAEEELAFGDVGAAFALDRGGAAASFLRAVGTPAAHAALKDVLDSGRLALAIAEE